MLINPSNATGKGVPVKRKISTAILSVLLVTVAALGVSAMLLSTDDPEQIMTTIFNTFTWIMIGMGLFMVIIGLGYIFYPEKVSKLESRKSQYLRSTRLIVRSGLMLLTIGLSISVSFYSKWLGNETLGKIVFGLGFIVTMILMLIFNRNPEK
jgi:uncharacterized protein YjeT (DUF2065 family)